VDKSETSWTGSTRVSTESLPSKALSMTGGAVLAPVGDSEPLDRSISQPNIAGGLKLPATVPPSPTVLASCSSTSSDLSRGGYVSADSLGSMSSKDDMLSAALTSDETLSLSTERSTRSASPPCHESVPSLSVTLEEEPARSSSLTASLEPTPDLVLNLPTTMSGNASTHTATSPTATTTSAAEMFASAEHGTIKKSGTPGRSSTSGEEGAGVDEVFPHTPVEVTHALEHGNSFSFDLLPAPPPALIDVPVVVMKSTDEECDEVPQPDDLPDFPLEREPAPQAGSPAVAVPACSVSLPSTSTGDISCDEPATVPESQSQVSSVPIAESVADASEESSSAKIDDHSLESKLTDLVVSRQSEPPVSEVSRVGTTSKLAELESVDLSQLPLRESLDLSEAVSAESTSVAASPAELKTQPASSVVAVDLCAAPSSVLDDEEVETFDQSSSEVQPAAALPVDVIACSSSAHAAVTATETPDATVELPPITSCTTSSNTQAYGLTVQSTASASPTELRPVAFASARPSSSPTCSAPSVAVLPQRPEVVESGHCAVARRSSESAVSTSSVAAASPALPQSAVSQLVLSTHRQLAASIAVTSGFPEPLAHRPPPSLAAHSAALQLLTEKHEPSTAAAAGGAGGETAAKIEQSPTDRPRTKPPPVKKKPAGPLLKDKFFPAASDDHH